MSRAVVDRRWHTPVPTSVVTATRAPALLPAGAPPPRYADGRPPTAIHGLGPERDNSIHPGLDPVFAPIERADYIICTGPFDDETETAEDYRAMMMQARER